MKELLERRQLLRERIATLRTELEPLLKQTKALSERVLFLEEDYRTVLDEIRVAKDKH